MWYIGQELDGSKESLNTPRYYSICCKLLFAALTCKQTIVKRQTLVFNQLRLTLVICLLEENLIVTSEWYLRCKAENELFFKTVPSVISDCCANKHLPKVLISF